MILARLGPRARSALLQFERDRLPPPICPAPCPGSIMRQPPDPFFNTIYAIDKTTDAYMIEAALDNYGDIFNEWDPAPFKRRELSPDLQVYLEGSSNEISFRYPVELMFTLPPGQRNEAIEQEVRVGLRNSFNFKLYLMRKDIKQTNLLTLRYVLMGIGTLWAARLLSVPAEAYTITSVLTEGLFIGGWVFLWEAVSLFFFSNREIYHRYRTYTRLRNALVIFREEEDPSPPIDPPQPDADRG